MIRRNFVKSALTVALTVATTLACSSAFAQAWPAKTVRIVVPFSAGGTTDVVARLLAQRLQEAWGQTVIVENKVGAAGNIGANDVAKSPNDGLSLLMASGSILTVNPHIYAKMPFDAMNDLVPITNVASGPMVVVVGPNVAAKNVTEFIALAKAKPGVLNFGSSGVGSQVHMAGENFVYSAGIDLKHVPYKGESQALIDVAGGSVEMMAGNLAAMLPFIKSGKIKALGVTSAERSPAAPDIPTVAEAGLPGFVNVGWFGLFAPAGTSKDIVDKIQRDSAKALRTDDMKQRLLAVGMVPVANTPSQLADAIRAESATWTKIVRERKIQQQ
ncbi:MAG: tripartite tricarboxylate transporter substrate binding protein [Casimicrobium sp.]|jgi:tripartite-type tricarboxylate transporter receptor subunit TctC